MEKKKNQKAVDKLYIKYIKDEKVWEVRCEHKDACKAMKKKLTKCDEYEVYG